MEIKKVELQNGELRWEVRYRESGRDSKRVTRRFSKKIDADTFVALVQREQRQARLEDSGVKTFKPTTFAEEATYWLEQRACEFSPSWRKRIKGILAKELIQRYSKLAPSSFDSELLTAIQMQLSRSGLKPASVCRHLEVIMAILRFSAKRRRIPHIPYVGYEKPRIVTDDKDFWEEDEAQDFLSFVNQKYPAGTKNRWIYVVYLLALNTALRAGEIWGLKPMDVKQNGEILHIQRQFDRVESTFRPTKGKDNRRVPCNSFLLAELRSVLSETQPDPRLTMFRTKEGNPICHDNFVKRSFNRDVKEWGGKRITFHELRHTAITLMIGKNLDLKTVQEIAGHVHWDTTQGYAHLLAEKIRDAGRTFSVQPLQTETLVASESHLRLVKS